MSCILVLLALGVSEETALGAPKGLSGVQHVRDDASLIDPRAKADLSELLARHSQATGEKLVLGAFESAGSESPKAFSRRTFDSRRNSVLLALFSKEREAQLIVGYGLEAVLTPSEQESLLDEIVRPALSEAGVTEAATLGTLSLLGHLESPIGPETPAWVRLQERPGNAGKNSVESSSLRLTVAIVFAALGATAMLCWAVLSLSAAEVQLTAHGAIRTYPWRPRRGRQGPFSGGGADGSW